MHKNMGKSIRGRRNMAERIPFRAELVIGQLVLITETDLTVLFEKEKANYVHSLDYEDLEKLADQALGETVILHIINGRATKVRVA